MLVEVINVPAMVVKLVVVQMNVLLKVVVVVEQILVL